MHLALQHGLHFSIAEMHLGNVRRKSGQKMFAGSVSGMCSSVCKGNISLVFANVKDFDMLGGVKHVTLLKHLDFDKVSGMRKF